MTARLLTEDRVRNYRAWCASRVGSLSGADIGVALADHYLLHPAWVEWKPGDAMPADGTYLCTCRQAWQNYIMPVSTLSATYWVANVVAYWPQPLPPPYGKGE